MNLGGDECTRGSGFVYLSVANNLLVGQNVTATVGVHTVGV